MEAQSQGLCLVGLGRIPETQAFTSSSVLTQGHPIHKDVKVSWHAFITAGWAEDSVLNLGALTSVPSVSHWTPLLHPHWFAFMSGVGV